MDIKIFVLINCVCDCLVKESPLIVKVVKFPVNQCISLCIFVYISIGWLNFPSLWVFAMIFLNLYLNTVISQFYFILFIKLKK